ncbi:NCS2 family permease [Paracoccus sp. KCTC 42845]|uniref:NCS2 family permease n=2 Tax=Paracoccus aerius TaxID=1915382 RepID=A0ABS1S284_9RHOB|nr:NCS2 family permease [Paracoccus aerius]
MAADMSRAGGKPMERYFKLSQHGSTVRTEVIAGITTFLTMAYIIFVNPDILSTTGMDRNAVFVATCLAAAIGSAVMGLWANWPIGMAPGMGLNAFFAFTVVGAMGFTWQQALGAVFISGLIFLFLSATGIRRWLVAGIPVSMRSGVAAGIGMFLGIIALQSSGIVVDSPATLVTLGDLTNPGTLLTIAGFFIIVALDAMRVTGAILIGILVITVAAILLGVSQFGGIMSMPPSIAPTLMQLDVWGALGFGIFHVILVMVLVEVFDATGTLIGVAKRAGLLKEGPVHTNPGLSRALMADSTAITVGSMLGTSSTTAYVESASGVQAGGRTGLTALVVALLFLLAMFFAPLAGSVPAYATAPALLYVATLMVRELSEIEWEDVTESAPAVLTALVMPFTYSIANGLAFGFISYAVIKLLTGKASQVHAATWIVAALFVIKFAFFGGH